MEGLTHVHLIGDCAKWWVNKEGTSNKDKQIQTTYLADILKCAGCHYVQGWENATAIPVKRHQELNRLDLVPAPPVALRTCTD